MAKSNMLDSLARNIDDIVEKALTKTAIDIEGDAKSLCPVDKGILRASITYEVDGTTATIGTNTEYAPYVELGTSKMSAQPYLYPAYKANKKDIQDNIQSQIRRL